MFGYFIMNSVSSMPYLVAGLTRFWLLIYDAFVIELGKTEVHILFDLFVHKGTKSSKDLKA